MQVHRGLQPLLQAGGGDAEGGLLLRYLNLARLAEVCGEYLKKGRGVRVVGRLKQDRRTSSEGQARSKVSIVAEHVEFKPQFKKQDGDGKEGEEKSDEAPADEQG
jgi:single-strand DNA-binding protein